MGKATKLVEEMNAALMGREDLVTFPSGIANKGKRTVGVGHLYFRLLGALIGSPRPSEARGIIDLENFNTAIEQANRTASKDSEAEMKKDHLTLEPAPHWQDYGITIEWIEAKAAWMRRDSGSPGAIDALL